MKKQTIVIIFLIIIIISLLFRQPEYKKITQNKLVKSIIEYSQNIVNYNHMDYEACRTAVTNCTELELFVKRTNIRVTYGHRSPRFDDLLKLKGQLLDLEPSTDPQINSTNCENKVFLTVMVTTSPKNYQRRQAIRDSWAYSYTKDIKLLKNMVPLKGDEKSIQPKDMFRTVFVIGKSNNENEMILVYKEAEKYNDIVFGSLKEDYYNLTMKTRLGFKWAYFECDTKYLLKTDDDVFVNPVKLTEWLKEMPREKFYTGWCFFRNEVWRKLGHKWYVSREEHPNDFFPPYCAGGGYILSNDVLGRVISMSYGRKYFRIEDVYVGTMIHEIKTVKILDKKRHFNLMFGGHITNCTFNHTFLAHPIRVKDMKKYMQMTRNMLTSSCSK